MVVTEDRVGSSSAPQALEDPGQLVIVGDSKAMKRSREHRQRKCKSIAKQGDWAQVSLGSYCMAAILLHVADCTSKSGLVPPYCLCHS